MSREMALLVEAFGYGWADLQWFTVNAMKSAFIPFDERLAMINEVIKPGYAELLPSAPVRQPVGGVHRGLQVGPRLRVRAEIAVQDPGDLPDSHPGVRIQPAVVGQHVLQPLKMAGGTPGQVELRLVRPPARAGGGGQHAQLVEQGR